MRILALAGLFLCASVFAQEYPAKPITAIIPFSAGSASDVIARLVLNRMEGPLGQRFVVSNIPAAGGVAGTLSASKAPADGYTIVMAAAGPTVVNKIFFLNVGATTEKDFAPISLY